MAPLKVAIFPWGDVIEEFLDPLGLTAEDFAGRMRGGWLFGYVAGLRANGVESVIIYASETVRRTTRLRHAETGAPIFLAPGRRSGGRLTAGRPSMRAAVQWLRTPWAAFAGILKQEGCSAILAQDYEHPRFDALSLLARSLRLPLFATFQGGDATLSPLEHRVRRRSLSACRGLIVPSARERARLAAGYGLQRLLADIPNPVDTTAWRAEPRQAARQALGVDPDAFLLLNHGRIDIHRKGLDVLLQAWAEFSKYRGGRLVIIGSGQDRAAFQAMADAAPSVTWLSDYIVDPAVLRRWLSAADAYVTLSRVEGMPVAPLEAMACGLPVIASDAHGLADIFLDGESSGGLLVPRERPDLAADAMRRLSADPALRAQLGAAARACVRQRYATRAVGAALAQLIKPVAIEACRIRGRRRVCDDRSLARGP